jgi:glucokinase
LDCFTGIDLGGTNTRVGLVSPEGLVRESAFTTQAEAGPEDWVGRLTRQHADLRQWAGSNGLTLKAAGLGTPGRLDRRQGLVATSPNLPRFNGFPLQGQVASALDLPTVLENDANAYAFGEYRFGAGQGKQDMACYTLGTGVGGGLIIGGNLVTGTMGIGGELGHVLVEEDGRLCPCGAKGCLEAYASATSLMAMLEESLAQGWQSTLESGGSVQEIAQAAENGDFVARQLMSTAGKALGRAAADLVVTTGVDLIVIGGGVARSWALMESAAREELGNRLHIADPEEVSLLPGRLGDQAAVLGAAALAQARLESQN